MKEVCPGIFMITEKGALGPFRPPVNLYVIAGSHGAVIDGGYGNRASIRHFIDEYRKIEHLCASRAEPFEVGRILLTHAHPDHFSGIAPLRAALGLSAVLARRSAELIATRHAYRQSYRDLRPRHSRFGEMLARIEDWIYEWIYGTHFLPDPDNVIDLPAAIEISGEQWELFLSPGHADDHVSIYNRDKGILFSGDNILRSVTTWLGPPSQTCRLYRVARSHTRAPRLDLILSAHGSPITSPRERIEEIISVRRRRTAQLLEIVRQNGANGITERELLREIYSTEGFMKRLLAQGWVEITLASLEKEGKISQRKEGRTARYYPTERG
jgi:glyoxylase-like metal-dependent hydrolase (beta-lactamase superfamily II)